MKKFFRKKYIFLFVSALLFCISACEDMLDTDSDMYAFEDDNKLDNPNDSLYSVMGILSQLNKLGDRYILFGELRGDLMTVSDDASMSLKELNELNVSADNNYNEKYDYYYIINNCNYAISRMDTSITINTEKVMMTEYAAIKVIRAWTYIQLVQAFGSASYIEQPILDLEASLAEYPRIDMDQLAETLIEDLLPYVNVRKPDYGEIESIPSAQIFFPVRMLLGDLYLYLNKYAEAATMYHQLMQEGYYSISDWYASRWTSATAEGIFSDHINAYALEVISVLAYSASAKDYHSRMIHLSYNDIPAIVPVASFMEEMSLSRYFYASILGGVITADFEGDLRGSIYINNYDVYYGDAYLKVNTSRHGWLDLIYKYMTNSVYTSDGNDPDNYLFPRGLYYMRKVPVFRHPHLYLRYAEAVNRAGKPTLAFATLKYGLNAATLADTLRVKVNPVELQSNESYINFGAGTFFDDNIGTAVRGRGFGIPTDEEVYVIPDFTRYVYYTDENGESQAIPSESESDIAAARTDSILWVEDAILQEMAAETAFEGNRFFDLLRMSRRRDNHPQFMAEKVAAKFDNPTAVKQRLMNIENWYLK